MPQSIKSIELKNLLWEWKINQGIATSMFIDSSVTHNSK